MKKRSTNADKYAEIGTYGYNELRVSIDNLMKSSPTVKEFKLVKSGPLQYSVYQLNEGAYLSLVDGSSVLGVAHTKTLRIFGNWDRINQS